MRALFRYAVSFGLMAAFLYWAFHGIDGGALWTAARTASPWWLAAIVATTLSSLLLRAWRWVVLLRTVEPQVTVVDAALALGICYAANIVLPRAGEAVRALSLKWRRGARVSAVLGTVVVERVLDLLWLVFFIGLSVLLVPGRIEQSFPWMRAVAVAALAGCALVLGSLLAVSVRGDRGVGAVKRAVSHVSARLAGRVGDFLTRFLQGLGALRTPSAYAEILISSCLLNLAYILIIYEAFAAFGFHRPPTDLGAAAALVTMAISSIGVVVPTPGGTGSYHFFFGRCLTDLFAVPEAASMACATAVHALASLTYVALGVPALLAQRRRHGQPPGSPAAGG